MTARLAQEVAEKLRSHIIDSHMNVGDRLPTESELMAIYDVSRGTVREAVKILQSANVVQIRHGLGSFVADNTGVTRDPLGLTFSKNENLLPELMEARLIMEPNLAALAAQRRTDADLSRMTETIRQMETAFAAGEDYHQYDYQFHIAVAQATHNSVIERLFPVITEAVEWGYAQTSHLKGSFNRALSYHKQILRAIEDGRSDEAMNITGQHIEQTLQDITEQTKGVST